MNTFRPYSNVFDVSDIPIAFRPTGLDAFTLVVPRRSPLVFQEDLDDEEEEEEEEEELQEDFIEAPFERELFDFTFGPVASYALEYADRFDAF